MAQGSNQLMFELSEQDPIETIAEPSNEVWRPQRDRHLPHRFNDFELVSDAAVNSEGELIHFALHAKCEPMTLEEALQDPMWLNAMTEEL